jgi:hypothetical protein
MSPLIEPRRCTPLAFLRISPWPPRVRPWPKLASSRCRRALVGVEEELDEQRLDRRAIMGDPAVAVGPGRAVL